MQEDKLYFMSPLPYEITKAPYKQKKGNDKKLRRTLCLYKGKKVK